jgi:hypothetical protein
MALFSRRPKKSDESERPSAEELDTAPETSADADAAVSDGAASGVATSDIAPVPDAAPVPQVGISLTTYGSPGTPATLDAEPAPGAAPTASGPAAPPGAAPPAARPSVPGLPDNRLLRDALAALSPTPTPPELLNVARQLLQGRVYVRVRGDARELIAANQGLPMAVATIADKKYVLAFSGGEPIQRAVRLDGDSATSAIGIPVTQLLRHVVDGDFGGVVLDHASGPATAVLPRALLEKALADLDETQAVKSALVGERSEESIAALVQALTTSPVWIAARRNDDGQVGVSEVRTSDGTRMLEVFSHPLELHVLGRGDQSVRVTAEQLAKALAGDEGLGGLIVNPHGPWMRLSREDLAPLLALA